MPEFIDNQFLLFVLIGFAAQLVDGALGMAYGLISSSFLLASGLPPATTAATVMFSGAFTSGTSAISHHRFGNIHSPLFKQLVIPGVLGAAVGAYLVTQLNGDVIRPYITAYLISMGLYVVIKSFREINPIHVHKRVGPLGFIGALITAMAGGGWGPIVTSTLLARGNHTRYTIGTVNTVEFFVTLTASVVFFTTIGMSHWKFVLALALGGVAAAPIAAFVAKKVPHRPMMFVVGLLIVVVSARSLWSSLP
jgi:uncharacterized membrane protein YfcA